MVVRRGYVPSRLKQLNWTSAVGGWKSLPLDFPSSLKGNLNLRVLPTMLWPLASPPCQTLR
jgi:hypothetical protein